MVKLSTIEQTSSEWMCHGLNYSYECMCPRRGQSPVIFRHPKCDNTSDSTKVTQRDRFTRFLSFKEHKIQRFRQWSPCVVRKETNKAALGTFLCHSTPCQHFACLIPLPDFVWPCHTLFSWEVVGYDDFVPLCTVQIQYWSKYILSGNTPKTFDSLG